MKVQIYALDAKGRLVHAGPNVIDPDKPFAECRRLERAWRKWRRAYLAENADRLLAEYGSVGPPLAERRLAKVYRLMFPDGPIDVLLGKGF